MRYALPAKSTEQKFFCFFFSKKKGLPSSDCPAAELVSSSILVIVKTSDLRERSLSRTTTMTVRLHGGLSDFVAMNVGENGSYENVSEYIRDLIRRDKERLEIQAFERLKAELAHAFAAPESSYKVLTAAEVIARNRT